MSVDEDKLEQARWFAQVLAKYDKIAIAGGPKSGKTTISKLAREHHAVHTDDYRDSWDQAPADAMHDLEGHDKWIIEGVQVGRCLRKGLKPDIVIWCDDARKELTPGQKTMAKGCRTIFNDWLSKQPEGSLNLAIVPKTFHVPQLKPT